MHIKDVLMYDGHSDKHVLTGKWLCLMNKYFCKNVAEIVLLSSSH